MCVRGVCVCEHSEYPYRLNIEHLVLLPHSMPHTLPYAAEFNKLKEKTDENKSKSEGEGQETSSGQKEAADEGNIKTAAASALAAAAVKTQVRGGWEWGRSVRGRVSWEGEGWLHENALVK